MHKGLFIALLVLAGCQEAELRMINEADLIDRIVSMQMPEPEVLTIVDQAGNIIDADSFRVLAHTGKITQDFYLDNSDEVVQIRVRVKTQADEELLKRINAKMATIPQEAPKLNLVDVDCSDKVSMLQQVYQRDQAMRKGAGKIDPAIDLENLEIVVSLMEKCGMPRLEEVGENPMKAIWLVLQHSHPLYQKKYINHIEQSARLGDIPMGFFALMKDRALMHEGLPQIYGSQVRDGALYDLAEPEYVNQRRAAMGLQPIEQYLKRYDIEFAVTQKQNESTP